MNAVGEVWAKVVEVQVDLLKCQDGSVVGGVDGHVIHEPSGVTPPSAFGCYGGVFDQLGVFKGWWCSDWSCPVVKGHEVPLNEATPGVLRTRGSTKVFGHGGWFIPTIQKEDGGVWVGWVRFDAEVLDHRKRVRPRLLFAHVVDTADAGVEGESGRERDG